VKNGIFKLEPRGDREIVIARTFDAPPELVFEAWTRPELLHQWWGCEGSTLTTCEVDLRPGGQWRLVMHMPDGSEQPLLRKDYHWSSDVAGLKMPTLLVYGDADAVRTEHAVQFFELLGGGKKDAPGTDRESPMPGWRSCPA